MPGFGLDAGDLDSKQCVMGKIIDRIKRNLRQLGRAVTAVPSVSRGHSLEPEVRPEIPPRMRSELDGIQQPPLTRPSPADTKDRGTKTAKPVPPSQKRKAVLSKDRRDLFGGTSESIWNHTPSAQPRSLFDNPVNTATAPPLTGSILPSHELVRDKAVQRSQHSPLRGSPLFDAQGPSFNPSGEPSSQADPPLDPAPPFITGVDSPARDL